MSRVQVSIGRLEQKLSRAEAGPVRVASGEWGTSIWCWNSVLGAMQNLRPWTKLKASSWPSPVLHITYAVLRAGQQGAQRIVDERACGVGLDDSTYTTAGLRLMPSPQWTKTRPP